MPRPARVSPDRILAAAALEFAERGFAGARVDHIARRAGVNKAMLYYHFTNKKALYRTLLRRMFTLAGVRLQAIAHEGGSAGHQVDEVIAAIAGFIREHAFFASIMLREVAEGGTHLDRDTLAALAVLPRTVGAIVQAGVARGEFRAVDPVFAYFTMVAPILFYQASAPIRKEATALHLVKLSDRGPNRFIQHVQGAVRRALAPESPRAAR